MNLSWNLMAVFEVISRHLSSLPTTGQALCDLVDILTASEGMTFLEIVDIHFIKLNIICQYSINSFSEMERGNEM